MVESYHVALCLLNCFRFEIVTTRHNVKDTLQALVCTFCESSFSLFLRVLNFDCQKEKENFKRYFMYSKQLGQTPPMRLK